MTTSAATRFAEMKAADFAVLLQDVARSRKRGRDEYTARCPSCQRVALSFRDGKSGIVMACYFGCQAKQVASALRLSLISPKIYRVGV